MPARPVEHPEGGTHGQRQVVDLASLVELAQARLTSLAGRGVDYLASSPEGRLLNLLGQTFVAGLFAYAVGRRELRKLNHPA